jgi:hypothetical protein
MAAFAGRSSGARWLAEICSNAQCLGKTKSATATLLHEGVMITAVAQSVGVFGGAPAGYLADRIGPQTLSAFRLGRLSRFWPGCVYGAAVAVVAGRAVLSLRLHRQLDPHQLLYVGTGSGSEKGYSAGNRNNGDHIFLMSAISGYLLVQARNVSAGDQEASLPTGRHILSQR